LRRTLTTLLTLVLVAATFSGLGNTLSALSQKTEISFSVSLPSPSISRANDYEEIAISGCGMIASIGKPMLPTKIVSVLIPPNGEVGDISLLSREVSMMKLDRKILPGQYPVVDEAYGISTFVEPDSAVYESEKEYPGALFENAGIQWLQGYKIQSIKIFPVQYSPKNGEIAYYKTMRFTLSIDSAGSSPLRNTFSSSKALVSKIVVNPDKIDAWVAPSAMVSMNPTIDYVIITDATFQSDFQALANWKVAKGLTARVYNTTWIYNNYEGVDNQEKIRNFIFSMYSNYGAQYVLLGGDYNIVPPRYIYMEDCLNDPRERGGGPGRQYKPTDYYYACLDGNWDTNNNGKYLEQLDLNGSGNPDTCVEPIPDFCPEVYVGRLPAATEAESLFMVNRTISYESSPPLGDWRNNALLLGAISNYQNEDGSGWAKTDDAVVQEWVKAAYLDPNGINTTTMYEKQGLDPSNITCTYWLNQTNVQSSWSAGCWIVSGAGHGDPQAQYRKIWSLDIDGDGIPDYDEILWTPFIDSTSMTLTNGGKLPQVYLDACFCGKFDDTASDCVAEWLLKSATGGAVAVTAASRISYYVIGWQKGYGYNQELLSLYWQEFFNPASGYRPGIALYWSKVDYWQEGFDMTNYAHKKDFLIYNLLGDPDLQLGVHTLNALANTNVGVLENGTLDIADWSLDAGSINALIGNPNVTLDEYANLGMTDIDMNNQMWPTGDPTSKFYTPTSLQSNLSLAFRQAIACLIDRDSIVRDVLNGYGYRMDVPVLPFQSQYIDMNNYTASGLVYNFNRTRAAAILDRAGFPILPSGLRQDPTTPGVALKPLIFYIRQDDPIRLQAGRMLTTELRNIGIPVNAIIADRVGCLQNVLVTYNYNLYTGAWAFDLFPTRYFDLYSSYMYYGPTVGRSANYVGFCNHDFDAWALKVNYPANMSDAEAAAKTAGYLFLKYCPSVPLYCLRLVEAYKTGWTGVVNMAGYGIDNYWSFLAMSNPDDITIDYGFTSGFGSGSDFNVITHGTMNPPDWGGNPSRNVLGLMYENMLGYNPFNLAPTEFFIANATSVGSWDATGVGGDTDATYVNFTVRDNVFWHNATGQPRRALDIYDINFTFYYVKACGSGVASNYPLVADFDHAALYPAENKIGIYYSQRSCWALEWAGSLPIINRDMWSNVAPANAQSFDPTVSDANGDGVPDIYEDGTGAWQFTGYNSTAASLTEDPLYYLSSTFISNRLAEMFHDGAGDVNRDGVVNTLDLALMARAMFTNNVTSPRTPLCGWGVWNPDCDLNHDGVVNVLDLALVATNYGKTMG